jgi:Zn-finger nucleic acid-binding protein
MREITVSTTKLRECENCLGLWLDVVSFEHVCADREQQSAILGAASPAPYNAASDQAKVKYIPCPECSQLMNRINFARCSGVIVDVCKGHGTWFDHDELSRIVEFIQAGGVEASRTRERLAIEEERKRLREEQRAFAGERSSIARRKLGEERLGGIASARGLLKFLLE